jgi:hypothetical protein
MISRYSLKRKYRPAVEALECKQLLSTVSVTGGAISPPRVAPLVAPKPTQLDIRPCGTGKGIIIITS